MFAEHGHQSDEFNSDDDPRLGWALTQLAFLDTEVRDLEDPAGALIARLKGLVPGWTAMGARLERMGHAADVCLRERRLIYVMGHTHEAMLKKIHIRPRGGPAPNHRYGDVYKGS